MKYQMECEECDYLMGSVYAPYARIYSWLCDKCGFYRDFTRFEVQKIWVAVKIKGLGSILWALGRKIHKVNDISSSNH